MIFGLSITQCLDVVLFKGKRKEWRRQWFRKRLDKGQSRSKERRTKSVGEEEKKGAQQRGETEVDRDKTMKRNKERRPFVPRQALQITTSTCENPCRFHGTSTRIIGCAHALRDVDRRMASKSICRDLFDASLKPAMNAMAWRRSESLRSPRC
ncbi:hypothetical protein PoB_003491700 [Plakobranchus ocellatus]|uniref:Uncharacterized protein n=1 Tax=Plakobranchus ocellatus TaxID=259542 RepID=A0AAV4ANB8_9GAST|nr:hypothetical protein PoB_003491700 [Plakobranchus ocellatus]